MFEELKNKLEELKERLLYLKDCLDIEKRRQQIKELEAKSSAPGFWDEPEKAQKIMQQIGNHREVVELYEALQSKINDLEILLQLAHEEEDTETFKEIQQELTELEKRVEGLELQNLFSEPEDSKNALLTIHPGAGGTESQDWAQMLLRMYLRWIERKGFEYEILDLQAGEEAGIKSATIEVRGKNAYGYLKAEAGVHRLVRISPFDANRRRHTSFASVFVYPEIEDNIEVKIDPNDLRIDTYRASGAGGQHVNKTSSAVRITHIPTGIVVQCQSERSQHRNKESAMKILRARLYQKLKEEQAEKLSEIEKEKKEIAWGSQIRSYVFQPYTMVKDHRTGVETGNIQKVMDGELDEFINAYLKLKTSKEKKPIKSELAV
ncbi:MAG: peptide chain release factor 2 [Calditrichaeota bacterium]|nr:MAG: peptide chain release factor 2 [Calditrichota bacterium]